MGKGWIDIGYDLWKFKLIRFFYVVLEIVILDTNFIEISKCWLVFRWPSRFSFV